ncbi:efflux RND transporter periplasmic adaptor subunit [Intrasporangium flavum]|uniref:efflux RND transporter periplasmic adaptor subunit n=1 Tax=Intrasporangium flavum TaxID=1428657 RepID=UPI001A967C4E|nr:HlyD family efflux transporter periplasmic adaptor subunit [Intrasporangium flavum]
MLLAAVLLLAGGGGAWALTHRASDPTATRTRTVTASLTTLQQTVTASGTIEPAQQADLAFGSAGTVTRLSATVGQKVTTGERLATIDDTTLRSQVDLASAQVTQAQTQVDASSTGTAAQLASARAQLASAQARLTQAQDALSAATLTAPFDGVVAAVDVQVGARVGGSGSGSGGSGSGGSGGTGAAGASGASTSTGGSGTTVLTVISTSSWLVTTSVTNADLPNVKAGLQAQVTPTGATQPLFGTVKSVGIIASSGSSGAAEFPVTIALTGHPTGVYAGTTASVSIIVRQLPDVLVVPTLAVRTENGATVVSLVRGGSTVTTPVTVGQVFGAQTQVTKGLSEGDQVVIDLGTLQRGTTGGTPPNGTGTGGLGGRGLGGFGGGGFGGGGGGFGGGGGGFGGQGRTSGQGG